MTLLHNGSRVKKSYQNIMFCRVMNHIGFPLKEKLKKLNSVLVCFRIHRSLYVAAPLNSALCAVRIVSSVLHRMSCALLKNVNSIICTLIANYIHTSTPDV